MCEKSDISNVSSSAVVIFLATISNQCSYPVSLI